jgi:hypothetical protein
VKDKGSNLNTLTDALKSIIKCETLGLEKTFREPVLIIFFPKHANMPQLMTKFIEA